METTDSRLLTGILEQADQAAKKKLQEAKEQASAILKDAEKRAESEKEAERRALEHKLRQIELRFQGALDA